MLAALLAGLGIAMIYSAGQLDVPSSTRGIWLRQLIWLAVALVALAGASQVPLRIIKWLAPWVYGGSLLLLGLALAVGVGPNGSWLDLRVARLQPSEVAKLGTILMLARELTDGKDRYTRLSKLWRPVAIVFIPLALVMLQPDLGSTIIFGAMLIAALFWAGVPARRILLLVTPVLSLLLGFNWVLWGIWFILVVAVLYFDRGYMIESAGVVLANFAAGVIGPRLWDSLAEYQQNRLLVFVEPSADPLGGSWQLIQSKVAIGSGGLLGAGFAQGPQKRLGFVPAQHTDFIFSVVGEELGFVGVLVFLVLFGALFWRLLRVAIEAGDDYGSLIVFCVFAVLLAHMAINIGMTIGLVPLTGLPLPLVSYGGSFLLVSCIFIGMVQRVVYER